MAFDELRSYCRGCFRFYSIYYARCRVRIYYPLHAYNRCICFFCPNLPPYVQRNDVRFLSETKRIIVGSRLADLCSSLRSRIYRICITLGANVLLGSSSNIVLSWFHTCFRRRATNLDKRRLSYFRNNT